MDKFRVELIKATLNPQQLIYTAMHQDDCENFVVDRYENWPKEKKAGELIVKRLLAGGRGHYGCLEHPSITLNCGYFPHSTMQQIRTHRIGISIDCQSNRYTGDRFIEFIEFAIDKDNSKEITERLEQLFYLRPVGYYTDRNGKQYEYTKFLRNHHLNIVYNAALQYRIDVCSHGLSKEHARGIIPFDVRQHWVMSLNVRSLMHLLDMRWKKDAQLECQKLCDLIWPHFQKWVPEIAHWYMSNRAKKAKLAP